MNEKAEVKVYRYSPVRDKMPDYDFFEVPFAEGIKVLDVVQHIYRNLDGALGFDFCCRNSGCGLCGVTVNGDPALLCRRPAEKKMTIEPLQNFPVKKDLKIDRSRFKNQLSRLRLFLERREKPAEEPEKIDMAAFADFKAASRCISCLNCTSVCPAYAENSSRFKGPAVFAQLGRHFFDPRDELSRDIIAFSEGIEDCIHCGACDEACPHDLRPQRIIEKIGSRE